jgi:hypothetical protein
MPCSRPPVLTNSSVACGQESFHQKKGTTTPFCSRATSTTSFERSPTVRSTAFGKNVSPVAGSARRPRPGETIERPQPYAPAVSCPTRECSAFTLCIPPSNWTTMAAVRPEARARLLSATDASDHGRGGELVQRRRAEVDLGNSDDALPLGLIREHVARRLLSLLARSEDLDHLAEIRVGEAGIGEGVKNHERNSVCPV